MKVWGANKTATVFHSRIPLNQDCENQVIGVQRPISDPTWLNLLRKNSNMVFTMSPPCPPWSPGGLGAGIRSEDGQAFLESISKIKHARPAVVMCECSESTPSHQDFQFLRACLNQIGYKACWSTVIDLDSFSGMKRCRWISVWIRGDVTQRVHLGTFKFGVQQVPWENPMYLFPTPDVLAEQLALSPGQLKIYSDPKFVPPGKRFLLPDPPTAESVLQTRLVAKGLPLPTLCASYTMQHTLSKEHISKKGIYASLNCDNGTWAFINPLVYLSMFGPTTNESVAVATKLSIICKQLGNSIALPHALLGWLVALNITGLVECPINETIRSAWAMRINADNSMVVHVGDFIWIIPDGLCMVLNPWTMKPSQEQSFRVFIGEKSFTTSNCSIGRLLSNLGLADAYLAELTILCKEQEVSSFNTVGSFLHETIRFVRRGTTICEVIVEDLNKRSIHIMQDTLSDGLEDRESIEDVQVHMPSPGQAAQCIRHEATHGHESHDESIAIASKIRFQLAVHFGLAMGSDECDIARKMIQMNNSHALFMEPLVSRHVVRPCDFNDYIIINKPFIHEAISTKKDFYIPVLSEGHWFGIEVLFERSIDFATVKFVNSRNQDVANQMFGILFRLCRRFSISVRIASTMTPTPAEFCGWALLRKWVKLTTIDIDHLPVPELPLVFSQHPCISFRQENGSFVHDLDPIAKFASVIRAIALQQSASDAAQNAVFGSTGDTSMGEDDPWKSFDPWSRENTNKTLGKWEDLKLQKQHGFYSESNHMVQVMRQQINGTAGGIAFATKTGVQDVVSKMPSVPSGLLVPATNRDQYLKHVPSDAIVGPIELTVEDPTANMVYKRQVFLIVLKGPIVYKTQQKPAYSASLPQMSELLAEIDTRICAKDTVTALANNAVACFKHKLNEQLPQGVCKGLNLYGYKRLSRPNDHATHQVIFKLPHNKRKEVLEKSGAGEVFFRDFLHDEGGPTDITTIPRFSEVNRSERDTLSRMTNSTQGFAGLTLTRRGLAARSWRTGLKHMRLALLANDERLCDENIDIFPLHTFQSLGWPPQITAIEVVRSTKSALAVSPIPMRFYKSMGVCCWSLAFESEPKELSFAASFDSKIYEIILRRDDGQMQPRAKRVNIAAKGKGKSKTTKESDAAPALVEALDSRVTAMEQKFGVLERRTDNIESKLQTGFEQVQDQLRQVLHHLHPRGSSEATGMTPPPKVPKKGGE
eukprot:Skav204476  [mRNA]  locus=scaffold5533:125515:129162:- [translate_table: standard]